MLELRLRIYSCHVSFAEGKLLAFLCSLIELSLKSSSIFLRLFEYLSPDERHLLQLFKAFATCYVDASLVGGALNADGVVSVSPNYVFHAQNASLGQHA